ncbi:DUF3833 domain-containing protein [Ruegeria sp. HKCCD7255]|uniref:DUF3833 domain-containing protein n=1 Tax=Ruegeria sp. HKCCD7255 TaxID=2683004 RepID=UPI001489059C|nr:DUF3833 domain-containing protein [Ruegeria sp. HKCCD7255]
MISRRVLIAVAALVGLAVLSACAAKPRVPKTFLSDRKLNLEEFFEGETVAYGQFQDILGNVPRRFTVEIDGTWDGETLTLVEDFVYDDGATEQRIWTLTKTGDDTWTGTASGVLGEATGVERGDTFNWKYKIDLPVKDGTMRVNFDDWMWLLSDDRLLNRAYVSRFGVRLGEVVLFFEKK